MWIVIRRRALRAAFTSLLLFCAALVIVAQCVPRSRQVMAVGESSVPRTWVIDAGHGGEDGGAVAADGTKESDVNLALARRLTLLLCLLGEETRMTRTSDVSIYSDDAATLRQKKRSDLENRVFLVNETENAVLVSIHQNSLPSSQRVHGAQVFYGAQEGSELLAQAVQRALNTCINADNEKVEKPIDASIYLMKNVRAPAILIECGFLSNAEEAARLKDAEYQKRLAVVIAASLVSKDK